MFALWPGDQLYFIIFKPTTFGFAGQPAASEAGHIANTNVGSNRARTNLCFKKTDDNFLIKISHRDKRTASQTTWTLKKLTSDRLKNSTADPSHFEEDCASTCPTHLAHAIAAQAHRDTKAMARAKSSTQNSFIH